LNAFSAMRKSFVPRSGWAAFCILAFPFWSSPAISQSFTSLGTIPNPSTSWAILAILSIAELSWPGPKILGKLAHISSRIPSKDWPSYCFPRFIAKACLDSRLRRCSFLGSAMPGTGLLLTASSKLLAPVLRYSTCWGGHVPRLSHCLLQPPLPFHSACKDSMQSLSLPEPVIASLSNDEDLL
jgi:hypothetical protein